MKAIPMKSIGSLLTTKDPRDKLFFKLVALVWAVLLLYALINIYNSNILGLFLCATGALLLNPIALLLFIKAKINTAKYLFLLNAHIYVYFFCIANQDMDLSEFYFIFLPVFAFLLFDVRQKRALFVWFTLPLLSWVALKAFGYSYLPSEWITHTAADGFYKNLNFLVSLFGTIVLLYFHIDFLSDSNKRTNESILSKNDFLQAVLDNVPSMIFVKNASEEFRFSLMNKAGEKLIGLNEAQLLGRNDFDFFPKEQAAQFRKKDLEVFNNRGVTLIESEEIQTYQGTRILRTLKVPTFDASDQPQFLIGISNDISDQVTKDRLLEKEREKNIQNSKLAMLGEMSAGVAHEINNPLAVIDGSLQAIEKSGGLPEHFRQRMESIQRSVKRISKIVLGLKKFSRSSELSEKREVRIGDIFKDVVGYTEELAQQKNVSIFAEKDMDLTLNCVPSEIEQVLINLVSNGIDAVQNLEERWVRLHAKSVDAKVIIKVCDSGGGIAKELASKIFHPFFTTKPVGVGTGLGLSISKGIVEAQGGELRLVDDVKHTCFEMSFSKS